MMGNVYILSRKFLSIKVFVHHKFHKKFFEEHIFLKRLCVSFDPQFPRKNPSKFNIWVSQCTHKPVFFKKRIVIALDFYLFTKFSRIFSHSNKIYTHFIKNVWILPHNVWIEWGNNHSKFIFLIHVICNF